MYTKKMRGVVMEEKQILKELLQEVVQIERDLKVSMWLIKNKTSNDDKITIVQSLEKVEEIYNRNLSSIKDLDYNYIKKDLKKINKSLDKLKIYKEKIKSSIDKAVI